MIIEVEVLQSFNQARLRQIVMLTSSSPQRTSAVNTLLPTTNDEASPKAVWFWHRRKLRAQQAATREADHEDARDAPLQ